jgi:hypothetical membrane protein
MSCETSRSIWGVCRRATIFNFSVSLLGSTRILAAYFIQRGSREPIVTGLFGMACAGAIVVAVFPQTAGLIHQFVSLITFLFGGLFTIAYRLERHPLNYLSVLLGAISLVALMLHRTGVYLRLGPGGMERIIAYPILLWLIGFGAQLMASSVETKL